jgi:hypothetical protein
VILRCTKRVLDLVGVGARDLVAANPTDDDWYANLFWLGRRKHLLLAHAGTLFQVFVADVRKTDILPLGQVIVRLNRHELGIENLAPDALGELDPSSVRLAHTASRSVLGYMNETAKHCEYAIARNGGLEKCDIGSLNRAIRRELHLSRRPPGFFVPIDLAMTRSGFQNPANLRS